MVPHRQRAAFPFANLQEGVGGERSDEQATLAGTSREGDGPKKKKQREKSNRYITAGEENLTLIKD